MTQLTEGAIGAALDARLLTFQGGGDINTEGTLYQPQAGQPYLSARVAAYVRSPMGIGPVTEHQAQGTYQINVNRPSAEGATMARVIAAQLVALFARGTAIALGTGQTLSVEYASEQPVIAAGDWLTVPVVVSWFCTE